MPPKLGIKTFTNAIMFLPACYLPGPSTEQYQFVYVDGKGEVCSLSSAFTFSAPKPLEELVTLEQAVEGGEDDDMLLVIPKAELLQVRVKTLSSTFLKITLLFGLWR